MLCLQDLVIFLDKWDCDRLLRNLRNLLEIAVRRKECSAAKAFMVAATARDDYLCQLAFESCSAQHGWPKGKDGLTKSLLAGGSGQRIWDPAHWPRWFFTSCPRDYLFALARAYGDGRDFEQFITLAKLSTPHTSDTAATDIVNDDEWVSGDLNILASDGVRFHVPSWYMLASS
jgi:hypothetical protein